MNRIDDRIHRIDRIPGTIHINQIGYHPDDIKLVFVNGIGGTFEVVNAGTNETVFRGTLSESASDTASGDEIRTGDFSGVTHEGEYVIRIHGHGESHRFNIHARPYRELQTGLLRSFYYQRCGSVLHEQHAGPWKHGACHRSEARVYGTDIMNRSDGGWHDAGDYGKYIVPAAKAVADLMLAYELYPDSFQDSMNIPDSGNGMPDVLNEVRYELDWMFTMQREDGGVYHKMTTYVFCGLDVMPEDDHLELVFSPVSYAATADYAAAMAMASRIYRPLDTEYADRCLSSALLAWQWVADHPNEQGFRNPPEIGTGEYGDEQLADELFWAAAELSRATQEEQYLQAAKRCMERYDISQPVELGWADVSGYGSIAILLNGRNPVNAEWYDRLSDIWIRKADELRKLARRDGYKIAMAETDYIWGSNMVLMNRAMHLIIASIWKDDAGYIETAKQHIHYLLGANPLDISYVTGYGGNPVMNPHHRPSVSDGIAAPVPGMVAGGPNKGLQDDAAKQLQGQPPARCFIDHIDSYATNEMTIYWNSPAVFVAAYLNSRTYLNIR